MLISPVPAPATARWAWLPAKEQLEIPPAARDGGIFVLGPLAGVTAAYMNFSLGFFVGGQVLAGLLGSTVTAGYGADGKHGANYIQTAAASVASMTACACWSRRWSGWGCRCRQLEAGAYLRCIGMFGVGVGMLYTPILVDRLQLAFPSGLAVANILRALTDPALLRRSIGKLGGGVAAGLAGGTRAPAGAAARRRGAVRLDLWRAAWWSAVVGIPAISGGAHRRDPSAVLRLDRLARARPTRLARSCS